MYLCRCCFKELKNDSGEFMFENVRQVFSNGMYQCQCGRVYDVDESLLYWHAKNIG